MKKKNFITLFSFVIIIIAVLTVALFKKPASKEGDNSSLPIPSNTSEVSSVSSASSPSSEVYKSESEVTPSKEEDNNTVTGNALFIGDSRTVGLMEYAKITDADFFCNVGMSVYNINKKTVSVPNIGKVTFTELISNKKYSKIYIMLGVNEVGYETKTTVSKYSALIDFIKEKQPDATVFIEANLHISKKRSDSDKTVNNAAIDKLHAELEKLSDGKTVFYIDANTVFDDGAGNLDADKTADGTHLYAKYYAEWGEWIIGQTALLVGKG